VLSVVLVRIARVAAAQAMLAWAGSVVVRSPLRDRTDDGERPRREALDMHQTVAARALATTCSPWTTMERSWATLDRRRRSWSPAAGPTACLEQLLIEELMKS
jgi:hypothetical protein